MERMEITELESAYKKNKGIVVPYFVEDMFVTINTRMMSHTHNKAFLVIDMSSPKEHQSPSADEYNQPEFIDEIKSMISRGVQTEILFINEQSNTPFEHEIAEQAQTHQNLTVQYAHSEMKDIFKVKSAFKNKNNLQSIQFAFYDEKAFICGFTNLSNDFPRSYSLNDKSDIKVTNQYINSLKLTM